MLFEPQAAEMHSLPARFSPFHREAIGVGAGERRALGADGRLRGSDVGRGLVTGHVVARLRHKPGTRLADIAARRRDERREILTVEFPWQRAGRVLLIRIALPLMPEHRPKSARTNALHPLQEHGIGGAVALPAAIGHVPNAARERGRMWKRGACWQPFADARGADPAGDKPDRNTKPLSQPVSQWR